MSVQSAIEWCDATWNPVRGCVKVSPGCKHCYAETFAERFRGVAGHPYEQGFDPRLVPDMLDEPLRWTKPRTIFISSMSDLFGDFVPDKYVDRVLTRMLLTPRHTYQVLTKRAERLPKYLLDSSLYRRVWEDAEYVYLGHKNLRLPRISPQHVPVTPWIWYGVSVENQKAADERIPHLLRAPAAVRFLSIEPLLGPVDLSRWLSWDNQTPPRKCHACNGIGPDGLRCYLCGAQGMASAALDWVIVGGESGPGAREMEIDWARDIVTQCRAAGVPVFVKQLGARPMLEDGTRLRLTRTDDNGKRTPDIKGKAIEEWPEDLRVREMPR